MNFMIYEIIQYKGLVETFNRVGINLALVLLVVAFVHLMSANDTYQMCRE